MAKALKFLDGYGGQSLAELLDMKRTYRVDSLVGAIEQALNAKPRRNLSSAEHTVLAVEAMEREVNNGGFHQLFTNSSKEHTSHLLGALERIGCPKVAAIARKAIGCLGLPARYTPDDVAAAAGAVSRQLGRCDVRYFAAREPIADRLLEFIEQFASDIRFPRPRRSRS
jgi:hypothetical protein